MDWLAIAFVVIASLSLWRWTPSPANWVLSGASLLCCLIAGHAVLSGYRERYFVALGFGFLIVALVPTYDSALRPVVSSSPLLSKHGLLVFALLFVALVPLIGAFASKMLFSAQWRVLGIAVLAVTIVLGGISGIAYWALYVAAGTASGASLSHQRIVAWVVIPGLFMVGVMLGFAAYRTWLGLSDSP